MSPRFIGLVLAAALVVLLLLFLALGPFDVCTTRGVATDRPPLSWPLESIVG